VYHFHTDGKKRNIQNRTFFSWRTNHTYKTAYHFHKSKHKTAYHFHSDEQTKHTTRRTIFTVTNKPNIKNGVPFSYWWFYLLWYNVVQSLQNQPVFGGRGRVSSRTWYLFHADFLNGSVLKTAEARSSETKSVFKKRQDIICHVIDFFPTTSVRISISTSSKYFWKQRKIQHVDLHLQNKLEHMPQTRTTTKKFNRNSHNVHSLRRLHGVVLK
jgi:hypothetical protein